MICIYEHNCTDFATNGMGVLQPLTCEVTETLNGEWELELTHDIDDAGNAKWSNWATMRCGCFFVTFALLNRSKSCKPG